MYNYTACIVAPALSQWKKAFVVWKDTMSLVVVSIKLVSTCLCQKNFTKVESNTHIPEHPFKNCRQRALPRTLRKVNLVMEFDGHTPNYAFVIKIRIMIFFKLTGRQFSMQKFSYSFYWSFYCKKGQLCR